MVGQMVLINPIEDSRGRSTTARSKKSAKVVGKMAKKQRTAKQKAATKRLVAMNKARKSGSPKKAKSKSKSKRKYSKKRSVAVQHNPIMDLFSGKKKRSKSKTKSGDAGGYALNLLMMSGAGAIGAVGLNLLMPHIPLPAKMNTPKVRMLAIAGAGGVASYALYKMADKEKGLALGAGVMVFVIGNLVEQFLSEKYPKVKLETVAYQNPAVTQAVISASMNAPKLAGLGYQSASEVVDGLNEFIDGFDDNRDSFVNEFINEFDDGNVGEFINEYDDRGTLQF